MPHRGSTKNGNERDGEKDILPITREDKTPHKKLGPGRPHGNFIKLKPQTPAAQLHSSVVVSVVIRRADTRLEIFNLKIRFLVVSVKCVACFIVSSYFYFN